MEQTTSKKQGERIAWIDTAKGLCLFLVVFGHLLTIGTWQNLKTAIYSFHMPMYFILAGWLMKPKNQKFSTFLKEKFFQLNFQYLGKEKNVETVKKCRLKILEKIIWLLYNRACAKEKGGVKNFGKISRSIW